MMLALFLFIIFWFANASSSLDPNSTEYQQALEFLDSHPLFDGHNDMLYILRLNFKNQFESFDLHDLFKYNLSATANISQTDINRLTLGKVSAQFWSIFGECSSMGKDAVRIHLEQIDAMMRVIDKYSSIFQLAKSTGDLVDAFANKKIASLLGLESGHAIDSSLALLRMYYELGVRYMTLTHNCDVPWATNSLVDLKPNASSYGGLSRFGKRVIQEMNRLGMMIDLSHTSYQTQLDVLEETQVPLLITHSSVYTLCPNARNVRDDVLVKLKQNGGIIMINFYSGFVNCNSSSKATAESVMDHLNYIKSFLGADYVGLGGNYDGVPTMPSNLEDVSKYPYLFALLIQNGWTEDELVKLAYGNILRVFAAAEKYASQKRSRDPIDDIIPHSDLSTLYDQCRTLF